MVVTLSGGCVRTFGAGVALGLAGQVRGRNLMLKKLLIIAGVAGAAVLFAKKVKASSDERALWHEATTAPDLR